MRNETKQIIYNPANEKGERWVENVSKGLRFVGYANEVCKGIGHTGWYTNEFQDETIRGVVYRMSNGKLVCGVSDPCNEDCAFIDFSYSFDSDDENSAAHYADSFAERYAENERDYNSASTARHNFEEAKVEIAALQESIAEMEDDPKKERAVAVLQDRVEVLERNMNEWEGWSNHPGWKDYN